MFYLDKPAKCERGILVFPNHSPFAIYTTYLYFIGLTCFHIQELHNHSTALRYVLYVPPARDTTIATVYDSRMIICLLFICIGATTIRKWLRYHTSETKQSYFPDHWTMRAICAQIIDRSYVYYYICVKLNIFSQYIHQMPRNLPIMMIFMKDPVNIYSIVIVSWSQIRYSHSLLHCDAEVLMWRDKLIFHFKLNYHSNLMFK